VYGPLVAVGGVFGEVDGDYCWHASGRKHHSKDFPSDLVAEYVEPVPVESPDDWVMLPPKHVLRRCVDYVFYSDCWNPVLGYAGYTVELSECSARCRRKDLPPVPPKTRTVVLKEWIVWDYEGEERLLWTADCPDVVWIHAIATGNERTVEVPCGRE